MSKHLMPVYDRAMVYYLLVMGDARLSMSRAMDVYEHFADMPEVGLMDEPSACVGCLAAAAHAAGRSQRPLTDVYLACFAQAGRLRIVTFDRDFERLAQCAVLRLSPPDLMTRP